MANDIAILDAIAATKNVKARDNGSDYTQYNIVEGMKGAVTDGSGSITTGGTSQQIFAANATILYLYIANPLDGSETLYVNFGTAASTTLHNSYELNPGDTLTFDQNFIPNTAVNIVGATTGSKYIAKWG